MMIILGYEQKENFNFPNNFKILVDYGIVTDKLTPGKEKYVTGDERSSAPYRKLTLLHNNEILSESIEKNPDEISYDQHRKFQTEGKIVGDKFERTFDFPNGYSAKIEYWISPTERDPKCGMYTSKYRKMILTNEKKNIISEIFEDNLDYFDSTDGVSDEEMYADGYTCY